MERVRVLCGAEDCMSDAEYAPPTSQVHEPLAPSLMRCCDHAEAGWRRIAVCTIVSNGVKKRKSTVDVQDVRAAYYAVAPHERKLLVDRIREIVNRLSCELGDDTPQSTSCGDT
jgi:hypothetical protein